MGGKEIRGAFHFNKIWVIESLPVGEEQTGTLLYEDLLRRKQMQMDKLHTELATVPTRASLVQLLQRIKNEVTTKLHLPLLHFEMHGSEAGMVLASGELVNWIEWANLVRQINIETRNNVVVTTAVCFGGYGFMQIDPTEPAPFAIIVGPFAEVIVADILAGFHEFFDLMLSGYSFDHAFHVLNDYGAEKAKFQFIPAVGLFNMLWKQIDEQYQDPHFLVEKVNAVSEAAFRRPGNKRSLAETKFLLMDIYVNKRHVLKSEMLDVFTMKNLPPHNFNSEGREYHL